MRMGTWRAMARLRYLKACLCFIVSCVRKTIAVTGYVVSVCKKEGPEATEKSEHRNE